MKSEFKIKQTIQQYLNHEISEEEAMEQLQISKSTFRQKCEKLKQSTRGCQTYREYRTT